MMQKVAKLYKHSSKIDSLWIDLTIPTIVICFFFYRFEPKHLTEGIPFELRFVKFQNVQSLSVREIIHFLFISIRRRIMDISIEDFLCQQSIRFGSNHHEIGNILWYADCDDKYERFQKSKQSIMFLTNHKHSCLFKAEGIPVANA